MARSLDPRITVDLPTAEAILQTTIGNERLEGLQPVRLAGDVAIGLRREQPGRLGFVYAADSNGPTLVVPQVQAGWPLGREKAGKDSLVFDAGAACVLLAERALFRAKGFRVPPLDYLGRGVTDQAMDVMADITASVGTAMQRGQAVVFRNPHLRAVDTFMLARHQELGTPYDPQMAGGLANTLELFLGRFAASARAHIS